MKRLFAGFYHFIRKPQNLIMVLAVCFLVFLVVFPLVSIIGDTLKVHSAERMRIPGAKVGSLTTYHWRYVLLESSNRNTFFKPLLNSLVTSLGSCFVAIVLGGVFAWLVSRTNIRWKSLISSVFMFPYIMPSWTLAVAWLNFFKNEKVGGGLGIVSSLTGIVFPDWFAYGAFPIIIVQGLHYAPFAYILIGGVLRNMNASLEEAALILETNKWRMATRITAPMILPSVLSAFILIFSGSISSFAVPSFLGLPVRYNVLTTQLYRCLNGTSPGAGYVIALLMIVISVAILTINQKIIGSRKSYTTVTGKSSQPSLFKLRSRNLVSIIAVFFVLLITVVPLLSFVVQSFIYKPGVYSFDNFTVRFWVGKADPSDVFALDGIFTNKDFWTSMLNSLKLALCCSLGAGTIGFLIGYAVVRARGGRLSNIVNALSFLPYLIPSMAFSAIYLSMFAVPHGPIPALYGTFSLLVILGTVKYLPMASRSGINSMMQISSEIEESAQVIGIGWFKRMTKVLIPIQKSSIVSGYLLPFISCMRELSLFVLLITPSNKILTTLLYQYNEKGWDQYSNAINLVIVVIVLLVNFITNKLTGASIDKGIGGNN